MDKKYTRLDPISTRYFGPLDQMDSFSEKLFLLLTTLSILTLSVDRTKTPLLYDIVQSGFIIGVILLFVFGIGVRLYFTPRAEDKRRQDLLSNSFDVAITHEQSRGYYNNDQSNPIRRLSAALLENSFFSKNIILKMAYTERVKIIVYGAIWLITLLNRNTDLALGAAMAQAIFSEQIISRWIRVEWLRVRFERIYNDLYRLFQTSDNFNKDELQVRVLEAFGDYETSKSYGGITLSSKIFERLNPCLSKEWEIIRKTLNL